MQTKVIFCNSENKSCLLQVVQTKAIVALTQFCDFLKTSFESLMSKKSQRGRTFSQNIQFLLLQENNEWNLRIEPRVRSFMKFAQLTAEQNFAELFSRILILCETLAQPLAATVQ